MSAGHAPRQRRRRSATESLLSIVLALDAILVFFVMMTAFGLDLLPPAIVFSAGLTLIVVLALAGRVVAKPWGIWAGHGLQLVLIALGFVIPAMFFVGALFAALWLYCFFAGRRLDRRNAALFADDAAGNPDSHRSDPSSPNTQE